MGLEDIKKRWEKVEQEMPLLVAPTRDEIQQHHDIGKLLVIADSLEKARKHPLLKYVFYDPNIGYAHPGSLWTILQPGIRALEELERG